MIIYYVLGAGLFLFGYMLSAGLFVYMKYWKRKQAGLREMVKSHIMPGSIPGIIGLAVSVLLIYGGVPAGVGVAYDQIALVSGSSFMAFMMLEHVRESGNVEISRQHSLREQMIARDLPYALERNQLSLHYQPQYGTASAKLRGFEALLRWNHPELGMVSPSEFIPAAESSGLIVPIGEWVLREACRMNKELQEAGFAGAVMSVNVSALQLQEAGFAGCVSRILQNTRLDANYLEIELTESVAVQCFDTCAGILNRLADIGVRIALDDFGTGYSSLSYLKQLPIHNVKIDRCFVQHLCSEPKGKMIVESIVGLAHQLGLGVVAEGIETEEQLACVKTFGCENVQGFLLGKPLPEADIWELIPRCTGADVRAAAVNKA